MNFLRRFLARLVAREWQQTTNAVYQQMAEMEYRMGLKITELAGEFSALKTQVEKIWVEQQAKFDALKTEFDALKAQLDGQELDDSTTEALAAFKAKLQEFDDVIPG